MRSRAVRLIYLLAIGIAMAGWMWMLAEGITWALPRL
jgi:hypothetical protein